jgi:hypothetical protein
MFFTILAQAAWSNKSQWCQIKLVSAELTGKRDVMAWISYPAAVNNGKQLRPMNPPAPVTMTFNPEYVTSTPEADGQRSDIPRCLNRRECAAAILRR